ncbi:MAG: hypothetical protein KDA89_23645, partial [Planctomycetaceae bacterium]|nr:hypothetical protein [Planctomycetaceae bacterium]
MDNRHLAVWMVLIVVLIALRPISTPDLWWSLSLGREVSAGAWNPAAQLLTTEVRPVADWLGGLPFFLLWQWGGVYCLAAVPVPAALLSIRLLTGNVRRNTPVLSVVFVPLFVCLARLGLQPTPVLYDLLFFGWLTKSTTRDQTSARTGLRSGIFTFLTFSLWANLSSGVLWGLLRVIVAECISLRALTSPSGTGNSAGLPQFLSGRVNGRPTVLPALLGCMVTPAGTGTLADAVTAAAPHAFCYQNAFGDATWRGLMDMQWTATDWGFILMWVAVLILFIRYVRRFRTASVSEFVGVTDLVALPIAVPAIPLFGGLLARGNLPICAAWMLADAAWITSSASRIATSQTGLLPVRKVGLWLVVTIVTALSLLDAAGRISSDGARLGLGISQQLDFRLLNVNLPPRPFGVSGQGTLSAGADEWVGWAPDTRSAGIAVWSIPGLKLVDAPTRALVGGRTQMHELLAADLLGEHRARYRRDDGSWGGWVATLEEWNVGLLFIPAEQFFLNQAMQRTTWRTIDLDSPTVPYVSTDDGTFAEDIVETLSQEDFVNYGGWQPSVDIYDSHGWRFDVVSVITGQPESAPAVRQSQRLRAAGLTMAALRSLLPVRSVTRHWTLRQEFLTCQAELLESEMTEFGHSRRLRAEVFRQLVGDSGDNKLLRSLREEAPTEADTHDSKALWRQVVELYIHGDPGGAAE